MNLLPRPEDDFQAVACLDIGTSMSGGVFTYTTDPDKIMSGLSNQIAPCKIPTCVLMDKKEPESKVDCFGQQAIDKYNMSDKEDVGPLYEHFKMQMYRSNHVLKERPTIKSSDGKHTMSVTKMLSIWMKFAKEEFLKIIKNDNMEAAVRKVLWVITIPASWSEGAKQIMTEAAAMADLCPPDCIRLCLEPVAATLWSVHRAGINLQAMKGEDCITIDAGGGTVDVCKYKIIGDDKFMHLAPPTSNPNGSTFVNQAFWDLLCTYFGAQVMEKWSSENSTDVHAMKSAFDAQKHNFKFPSDDPSPLYIPVAEDGLISALRLPAGTTIESVVKQRSAGKLLLEYRRRRIAIPSATMISLLDTCVKPIIESVKRLISDFPGQPKHIFLAGGFAQSGYLQVRLREAFPKLKVVVPPQSASSIMCGGVTWGRTPERETNSIFELSYGISTASKWDEEKHKGRKKIQDWKGEDLCSNCFCLFFARLKSYSYEHVVTQSFTPIFPRQDSVALPVFCSSGDDSKCVFTDDPTCRLIGCLTVPMEIPAAMANATDDELMKRSVVVTMTYKRNRFVVLATDKLTNLKQELSIDFLVV